MTERPRVAFISGFPRTHSVETLNELQRLDAVAFKGFYLQKVPHGRYWKQRPDIRYEATFLPELRLRRQLYLNPGFLARFLAFSPDLIVVGGYHSPAMQLAMYVQTLRRRPWVLWGEIAGVRHAEAPIVSNEWLRQRLRALGLFAVRRFPTEIWAIGTRAQASYRALVRDRIPVRNIPYTADFERFAMAGDRREPSTRVRFLFNGSLIARKGADVVAEAVRVLSREGCDFELHIVGAGPLEGEFEALSDQAHNRITLHGFLDLDRVPDAYALADVLLFPSRHDGWGLTLAEGMAAAMPAISTRQAGAAEDMLEDGQNGLILPRLDVDRLTRAMRWFIDHADRIPAMGSAARATTRDYSHKVGARRFVAAIEDALTTAAAGAKGDSKELSDGP